MFANSQTGPQTPKREAEREREKGVTFEEKEEKEREERGGVLGIIHQVCVCRLIINVNFMNFSCDSSIFSF